MIERARQTGAGRLRPKVGQLRARKYLLTRVLVALAVSATALVAPLALESESAEAAPSENVVQFVYFVEADQEFREDHRAAIESHAFDIQQYWYEQFGATFTLANPVVAVVRADHDAEWYETNPVGKIARWYRLTNMSSEIKRKLGSANTRFVSYPTTRIDGRVGATVRGAWMDYDDLTCVTGEGRSFPYPDGNDAHCLGHVAHELGHVFGIMSHPGETNADCMTFGFYNARVMCQFGEMNRDTIRNSSRNDGWLDSKPGDIAGGGTPATTPPTTTTAPVEPTTTTAAPVEPKPSGVITVKFINDECRTTDVYWDRNGTLVKYRTIAPGRQVNQRTYANHTWVFKVGTSVVGRYTATQNGSYEIPSGGCNNSGGTPTTTPPTPVVPTTTTTAPVAPTTTTPAPVVPKPSGVITVKFINDECRTTDVYWDRNGTLVKYRTIAPGRQVNQRTYANHTWVFKVGTSVVGRYTATQNGSYEIPSGGCNNSGGTPTTTPPTTTPAPVVPTTAAPVVPKPSGVITVKFINDECRTTDVYWDRNGTLVKYRTIAPGRQVNQRTYANHTWVFKVGTSVVGRYTATQSGSYEIPSGGC